MRGFKQRMEVDRFQALIRERVRPVDAERVPLACGAGRVLSEPIVSEVDVPAFPRSAMDGYAVRSEETYGAGPYNPLTFRIVGEVTPGKVFPGRVGPGEAVRIMTGAPIPDGADAVLMAESTREADGVMTATETVTPRKNIGRIGEDIKAGTQVFAAGRLLRAQDIGVLASIAGDLFRPQSATAQISPDGTTIAYLRAGILPDEQELVLYRYGTGESFTVDVGTIQWEGWAPDSVHFVYAKGNGLDLFLGEVGLPPRALGSAAGLRWMDEGNYLYLSGTPDDWTLTLGSNSGEVSPLIELTASEGVFVAYDFAR